MTPAGPHGDQTLRIMTLDESVHMPLGNGRGEKVKLIDERLGTAAIDVHHNTLAPGGPRGTYHRHSKSVNIYIVTDGAGELVVEGETHTIRKGHIVFIPAGMPHSLHNAGDEPFAIFEIYAPAGPDFDFVPVEES